MTDDAARLREALTDDESHAARVHFARTTMEAIEHVGGVLHLTGHVLGDDAAAGVSVATRIGGALARGACDLLDAGNAYAAAALVRQLVEVEYLLWTFTDDPQDAVRWLSASRSQLDKHFTPKAMRERSNGVFRAEEYRRHCNTGGHPDPTGATFLLGWEQSVPALWADLGQHVEHVWNLLVRATYLIERAETIEPRAEAVFDALNGWRERDPWAFREPFPDDG